MQTHTLTAHYQPVVMYGDRFKVLRKQLWTNQGKTVLALAAKLGSPYPATIYNIEKSWRAPLLPTLLKHATALGCRPWDLLVNVETEYDLVRRLAALRPEDAEPQWRALLRRYSDRRRTASRDKKRTTGEVDEPTKKRRQVG